MPSQPQGSSAQVKEATTCLLRLRKGDASARDRLFELLYTDLRKLASGYMARERLDHTLQTSALVNEAWLRLIDYESVGVKDKGHFLALAAQAMRRILIDHKRGKMRGKRGGAWNRIGLDEKDPEEEDRSDPIDLLALDQALDRLREESERMAQIVEMRFFAGLTREEVADALGVSRPTVARDWRVAKAMLSKWMDSEDSNA